MFHFTFSSVILVKGPGSANTHLNYRIVTPYLVQHLGILLMRRILMTHKKDYIKLVYRFYVKLKFVNSGGSDILRLIFRYNSAPLTVLKYVYHAEVLFKTRICVQRLTQGLEVNLFTLKQLLQLNLVYLVGLYESQVQKISGERKINRVSLGPLSKRLDEGFRIN